MKLLKPKVRVFRRKSEQFLLTGVASPSKFEFRSNASEIVRILCPSESEVIQSLNTGKATYCGRHVSEIPSEEFQHEQMRIRDWLKEVSIQGRIICLALFSVADP